MTLTKLRIMFIDLPDRDSNCISCCRLVRLGKILPFFVIFLLISVASLVLFGWECRQAGGQYYVALGERGRLDEERSLSGPKRIYDLSQNGILFPTPEV